MTATTCRKGCAALLTLALGFPPTLVLAQAGGTISNGSKNFMSTELFFEPETPFVSLKESPPTWNEIEQLLDNPYSVDVNRPGSAPCSDAAGPIPGNDVYEGLQHLGAPAYCTNGTFTRRASFLPGGAPLPRMLVHPLNYNAAIGVEMRLVNSHYSGGTFDNTGICYGTATTPCTPPTTSITVSPGASRLNPGEAEIDYNVRFARGPATCQANPEPIPLAAPLDPTTTLQDVLACGASPGEPGYAGFGRFGTTNINVYTFTLPPSSVCSFFTLNRARCDLRTSALALAATFPAGSPEKGFLLTGTPLQAPLPPAIATFVASAQASPVLAVRQSVVVQALAQTDVASMYSTPAVPGVFSSGTPIPTSARLFDPERGYIQPRDFATGAGGLRKPSLRVPEVGGSGSNPNFLWNSEAQLAARGGPDQLAPSNENDYIAGATFAAKQTARLEAIRLGKSLFWDQQVGSDAVQACGSCHAHAGADNRTKNQMNPNDLATDFTFEIGQPAPTLLGANHDLVASDFPIHKLFDPEIAGDPNCVPPIVADVTGITFPDGEPPIHPLAHPVLRVCDAANIANPRPDGTDQNDVASSMGVHFGTFLDIPVPGAGAFGPASVGGVRSVLPDLRSPVPLDNLDPIPGFAGTDGSGHQFRRVEPRNTPTVFLADINFDNFWDGRARHDDNGGSVFGPADPQSHIFVNDAGSLVPTRQLIKFSSLASLAKGPALSQFEMSFLGRNWAKIAKKLLQAGVTPLANQLVSTTDSILGPYSNQGGASSACTSLAVADRSGSWSGTNVTGKPGLCISYQGLIRHAFQAALHNNTTGHLNGCYTDARGDIHPNQCSGLGPIPILDDPFGNPSLNTANTADPFDQYRLTPASGAAVATKTDQFTQMEANFSLFFGQAIHLWATILVPDDTPWDKWLDRNPDGFYGIGETGELLLTNDLPNCGTGGTALLPSGSGRYCFVQVGNFKRDNNLTGTNLTTGSGACISSVLVQGVRTCTRRVAAPGTRVPGSNTPDPLLGMDLFFGSNVSLKNPLFRSARCGECHAPPTLTDHTFPFTVKATLKDVLPEFEFRRPDIEPNLEPPGRERIISGFLLESEINEPGQDAIERRVINQSIAPAPVSSNVNCTTASCSGYAFPDGITNDGNGGYVIHSDIGDVTAGPLVGDNTPVPFTSFGGAFFDNGMYNLGVTQCQADQKDRTGRCDDLGRGNTDAFGWPLSFAALLMKNFGGPEQQPGDPIPTFDPSADAECAPYCATGGLLEETGQDQQINPGFSDDQIDPLLPPYLAPSANKITVGDEHPELDEAGGPVGGMVNHLMDVANAEGFPEFPVDSSPYIAETLGSATATGDGTLGGPGTATMGTWPVVNRVGRFGSFKAPQLREVELTGPYFHNGGKLTLRQVVDFYVRGGDYPVINAEHRDFNILNLNAELQSNLSEEEKVALVDFLLELTDDRVRFERGPFDHPQMILPLDGTAPEPSATYNRDSMLTGCAATSPTNKFGPGQQACAGGMFLNVPAVGSAGNATPLPNFLGIASGPRLIGPAAFCPGADANNPLGVANNQYCH